MWPFLQNVGSNSKFNILHLSIISTCYNWSHNQQAHRLWITPVYLVGYIISRDWGTRYKFYYKNPLQGHLANSAPIVCCQMWCLPPAPITQTQPQFCYTIYCTYGYLQNVFLQNLINYSPSFFWPHAIISLLILLSPRENATAVNNNNNNNNTSYTSSNILIIMFSILVNPYQSLSRSDLYYN